MYDAVAVKMGGWKRQGSVLLVCFDVRLDVKSFKIYIHDCEKLYKVIIHKILRKLLYRLYKLASFIKENFSRK